MKLKDLEFDFIVDWQYMTKDGWKFTPFEFAWEGNGFDITILNFTFQVWW